MHLVSYHRPIFLHNTEGPLYSPANFAHPPVVQSGAFVSRAYPLKHAIRRVVVNQKVAKYITPFDEIRFKSAQPQECSVAPRPLNRAPNVHAQSIWSSQCVIIQAMSALVAAIDDLIQHGRASEWCGRSRTCCHQWSQICCPYTTPLHWWQRSSWWAWGRRSNRKSKSTCSICEAIRLLRRLR